MALDLRPRIVIRHPTFGAHVIDPFAGGGGSLPYPLNEATYSVEFGEPEIEAGGLALDRVKWFALAGVVAVAWYLGSR